MNEGLMQPVGSADLPGLERAVEELCRFIGSADRERALAGHAPSYRATLEDGGCVTAEQELSGIELGPAPPFVAREVRVSPLLVSEVGADEARVEIEQHERVSWPDGWQRVVIWRASQRWQRIGDR